jgi:hypothetical protein
MPHGAESDRKPPGWLSIFTGKIFHAFRALCSAPRHRSRFVGDLKESFSKSRLNWESDSNARERDLAEARE